MKMEVKKLRKLFAKHFKTIFGVFFVAMLIFLPFYTKYLLNPDTLIYNNGGYYRGIYWELSLGRWGIMFLDTLFGGINSPVLNSIVYILCICAGIVFLSDLFEVDSERNIFLLGLLLLITPFTGNILTYYYCSYDYGFAFLFMVLACWIYYRTEGKWIKFLACSLCICLSFSLYQSYAGVGSVLAIGMTLYLIIKKKDSGLSAIKKMFGFAGNAFCGGILYIIILKIGQTILHTDMAEYKGADEISLINMVTNFGHNIIKAYREFFAYYFEHDFIVTGSFLSIQATSGIGICLPLIWILLTKIDNKRIEFIAVGLLFIYLWTNCIQIQTDAMALEYSYRESTYALEQINDEINEFIEDNEKLPVVIMGNPEFGEYPLAQGISDS